MHLGRAVLGQDDARRAVVVEALRVADVLEADGEPDPTSDSFTAGRVPRTAGQPDHVAWQLLRRGRLESSRSPDHVPGRQRAGDDLAGREGTARLECVQEPELDRVDVERGGEPVHLRLGREAGLHRAEAAHRTARRVVRVDGEAVDQHVVHRVRPDREGARVRDHGGRARGVGPAVDEDPHPHRDEPTLSRRPVLGPDPSRMPVDVPDERLLAVVDHLHGPVRPQGQHRRVDLDREVLPPSERAADTGEVDPHLLRLEAEAGRDLVAVDVEPLRRDVDVDAALSVGNRDPRLRPQERLILLPDLVDPFDTHIRGRVGIAPSDPHRADDVRPRVVAVPMPHRGPIRVERIHLRRPLGIGDRLERLVFDPNGSSCPASLLGLLGRHDRHRLAEVAHAVDREHRLVGELEPVRLLAGDVVVREDSVNPRQRQRLRDVDLDDARMGVRAADGVAPQHPGCVEVARVGELARDLGHRVGTARAGHGPAPSQRSRRGAHGPAAWCTASRIFW